jgi:uncharacterized protein YbjT (DUF2867 family)
VILVTGAGGVSGSIVIGEFVRQGIPVRALVRSAARAGWLRGQSLVEVVEADMARAGTLGAALEGVERALLISSSDEEMVDTQCTFIDAAAKAGVGHVVKFSGRESGVGFDPTKFRFTRMHQQIERYLEASGLAWTHLRPSQFMQVYLREVPTIVAEDAFFLPMGNVELSPVDIEDVAKVAVAILNEGGHESRSYAMTGPQVLTGTEVAEHLSAAIGRPIRFVAMSREQAAQSWRSAGLPPERVAALTELFDERRRHPKSRVELHTHESFGIPATTFAEFARRNASAFRGEPGRVSSKANSK